MSGNEFVSRQNDVSGIYSHVSEDQSSTFFCIISFCWNTRPIIVHTPSATGGKGTRFVRNAIDRLKSTLDFEYLEIVNKTHKEALETIAKADIFLDQFLAGAYGMASCEAMAMGKPVFCFLLKPLKELLPEDCPIVNVDIDSLEFTLKEYILNATLRNQTGIKSRQYVESYHDANKVCRDLNAKLLEIINSKHESV
jgi:glycosyltransferase involved in cell wall biosynthesis